MGSLLSRAEASRIRSLHQRRGRERAGSFLAEGVRAVSDLLDSGLEVREAVVTPSLSALAGGAGLLERLRNSVEVHEVEDHQLGRLAATEAPQGVLAVARVPDAALPALRPEGAALALVLDRVQDPGNLGTLVRTAEALGARLVAEASDHLQREHGADAGQDDLR
jgi:RNA methyltransferase, TrmH family